jgi:hypothetical protein
MPLTKMMTSHVKYMALLGVSADLLPLHTSDPGYQKRSNTAAAAAAAAAADFQQDNLRHGKNDSTLAKRMLA